MTNTTILLIFTISLIISLIGTFLIRQFALRRGFTDKPTGGLLKIHRQPIALLGGIPILIVIISGLLLLWLNKPDTLLLILGLGLSSIFLSTVGLIDDFKSLDPFERVLFQIIAVTILFLGLGKVFNLSFVFVAFLALIYIIPNINASNMIDGMDGLCAGLVLTTILGFGFWGYLDQNFIIIYLSVIMAGALIGFLFFNFHPAKIFLGSGSELLGFIGGALATLVLIKDFNLISLAAIFLILGIPIIDMSLAILRRVRQKKSIFMGDRQHIYDLLLKRGLSQRKVWFTMIGGQLILNSIGVIVLHFFT